MLLEWLWLMDPWSLLQDLCKENDTKVNIKIIVGDFHTICLEIGLLVKPLFHNVALRKVDPLKVNKIVGTTFFPLEDALVKQTSETCKSKHVCRTF